MIRLTQAIVAVMSCTLVAGAAGGIVGAAVGRLAPGFVRWLYAPGAGGGNIDPTEFGFGLGVVSGLFFGVGTGVFLVCVLALRDAWLARSGIAPYHHQVPYQSKVEELYDQN
jgi:hypothetical protein